MNPLTDKEFWLNYRKDKTGLVFKVPDNDPVLSLMKQLKVINDIKNLLDFPGLYSVWEYRNFSVGIFKKTTWYVLMIFTKLFSVETKALSPYIVITARA
jgi:hypothetical protein